MTSFGKTNNGEELSLERLEYEIERTWYKHLELRNEVYEMDMGPSDILDVFISSQKTRRPSMSRDDLFTLMKTNFNYHVLLRRKFYHLLSITIEDKAITM